MLDLNKALSRLNAMTPQDITTLLKETLNESEIPYTTSPGKYTIEDFLSAFQDDLSISHVEFKISNGSASYLMYDVNENAASLQLNIKCTEAYTYSIPDEHNDMIPLAA